MANILLDYFFPITAISPTPAASTAFLKQACIVVSPKDMGVTAGVITACTTMAQVSALTDNVDAQQLFNAGMSRVYVLPMDDLDLADALEGHESDFFTVLVSSDFDKDDINATQATGTVTITDYADLISGTADVVTVGGIAFTAQAGAATLGTGTFQAATSNDATATSLATQINAHASLTNVTAAAVGAVVTITAVDTGSSSNAITLTYTDNDTNVGATVSGATLSGGDGLFAGEFTGVIGVSSDDTSFLATQAAIENRCAFYTSGSVNAKNMCYAFGKLLSNALTWINQQYITMPFADDVETLGDANALFDDKVSFVISDDEFGERLALFACGGKAIVAPYIKKNLELDLQSKALTFISGNQPNYTLRAAALLEDSLQKVIDVSYIDKQLIEAGTVEVKLEEDNFVASGYINISEPKAMWRIFGEIRQTL